MAKLTKSELKELIKEALREELDSRKRLKENYDDQDEYDEVLDVSASEVDDLARDVYIDDKFEAAYKADGHTVGDAVYALVAEVVADEYPDIDLGAVPERVRDSLENMLESGLLD